MLEINSRPARGELRRFVRVFAQRRLTATDNVLSAAVPARLEQTLEFQFGEPVCFLRTAEQPLPASAIMTTGAITQPGTLAIPGGAAAFGIFFQPTGLTRLLGLPAHCLSSAAINATDVVGRMFDSLHQQLSECDSFDGRVQLAEIFLRRCAASIAPAPPIDDVAAYIFAAHGAVRLADMARHLGVGLRQFERRFHSYIGIPPKLYTRIARFQTALDSKISSPQRTWLDIAHSLGYHDQMHLVRDFHGLGGDTPGRIISSIEDIRPPATLLEELA